MSQQLAKSPEMLRKEAEIKDLQAQLKKKQPTLRGLKTRLQNMRAEIEGISQKVHATTFRKMGELDKLRMEIADLALQLKKVKGMSRDEKEQLQMLADEISAPDLFGPEYKDYVDFKHQEEAGNFNFDEFERAKVTNMFQEFAVKPDEKEQKDIRKVFLKLSQKFHPDLAKNEKEAKEFHQLMQQINAAYQQNDIQTLLELESMYLLEELDFSAKAVTVDVLQQEIDRLKRDLLFIEQQIERTSQEIQNLRQSDLGKMLTSLHKAERAGNGLDDMTAELDNTIIKITKLRDGLKDSMRLGTISPLLIQFMVEEQQIAEDEFDNINPLDMLLKMAQGDEDAFRFFDSFEDDDDDELENPAFPVGSSVRVKVSVKSPFDKKTDMKGWQGRIERAYYDGRGAEKYTVAFDSQTIAEMPAALIENAVGGADDFQEYDFREKQLEPAQSRDTKTDTIAAFRRVYHGAIWNSLPDKNRAARFRAILLANPTLTDEENWSLYFRQQLVFPFEAKSRGETDLRPNVGVTVFQLDYFDPEYGQIVIINVNGKRNKREHPLLDLIAKDENSPAFQILEDYAAWAEETLYF